MSRILLVDDEPRVLRALAEGLGDQHEVEVSTSAQRAKKILLSSEPFDAIVADQVMPIERGHELLSWCYVNRPDCKRFLLTGIPFTADLKREVQTAGEIKIFLKPWDLNFLSSELDKASRPSVDRIIKKGGQVHREMTSQESSDSSPVSTHFNNRLLVFENFSSFSKQFIEDVSSYYDKIVWLDQQSSNEAVSNSSPEVKTEMLFHIVEPIESNLAVMMEFVIAYEPQHVLIVAKPAVARILNHTKFDDQRFTLLSMPLSSQRFLQNLWFNKPVQ